MGRTYIGLRLKSLRRDNDMTQQDLAKALGIAKSTIGMYELGQRDPDYETLELIADYFNTPMASFFPDGNPEKNQLTDKNDELTPTRRKIIRIVKDCTEQEAAMIYRIVQAVLAEREK